MQNFSSPSPVNFQRTISFREDWKKGYSHFLQKQSFVDVLKNIWFEISGQLRMLISQRSFVDLPDDIFTDRGALKSQSDNQNRAFCLNSYQFSDINYFRKSSILDIWLSFVCTSEWQILSLPTTIFFLCWCLVWYVVP